MRKHTVFLAWLCLSFGAANAQITVFPHTENWESQTQCGTGCATACVLTNGWTNDLTDDIDWAVDINGTGSFSTGPTANGGADHNPGVAGGKYLYTETSSGCNGDTARLLSPEIHVPNTMSNFTCEWWWHMFGADQATSSGFYVDVRRISGGTPGPWTNVDFVPPVNIDLWQNSLIDLSAYIGDTIEMRWWYRTGNSFGSDAALDDIHFYELLANDAGVVAIDAPVNPILPGLDSVCVTIENFGFDTLFNATIGWTVDGVAQAPFVWNGALPPNSQAGPICLGNYNFQAGLTAVCAWTSMPNMVQDSAPANDTACRSVCTPLRGTYTLGTTGDFGSFQQLGSLLSSCGVDSHVIVNVLPGAYMDDLHLDNVPGTADTATILIDGGDTSLVWLESGGVTIEFEGTDWTTIRNITIKNTATTDGFGVQFHDSSTHNTIDSCRIIMPQLNGAVDLIGVSAAASQTSSFTEGQNAFWTTVSNCHIIGGEKGIHFEGQNGLGNRNIGNRFIDNWIQDCEDYGVYIDDQDSMTIRGNTIESTRWTAFGDGIYCFDIQMFEISYNHVTDIPDWGLYVADGNYSLDGTPSSRGRIFNNMISSQTDYGIYLDDFEFTDIYHNTVYSNSTFSGAIRINDFQSLDIRNNIFFGNGDYAFESDEATNAGGILNLNYNLYFTTPASGTKFVDDGPNLYGDLGAWQTGRPAHNVTSVEGDPFFVSAPVDLHLAGTAANDIGQSGLGINDDIDGDPRPAGPNPDVGADEYTPLQADAVLAELLAPTGLPCGDTATPVILVLKNLGQDTIFSLPVTVQYAGSLTGSLNATYTGQIPFGGCDTFVVGTINTFGGAANVVFEAWVALPGDQNTSNDSLLPAGSATFIPLLPFVEVTDSCIGATVQLCGASWPGVDYAWFANPFDSIPSATQPCVFVPGAPVPTTWFVEYADNADSLRTTLQAGNGCGGGNMFDLAALNTVSINAVSVNTSLPQGSNLSVTVHFIPNGTYAGNETNAGPWTTLGTFNAVSAGGGVNGPLTYVDFGGAKINIPAGATYAIYVEYPANYTTGAFPIANASLSFQPGVGLCGSFSGINNPRTFNGAIHYGATACSDARIPVYVPAIEPPRLTCPSPSPIYVDGTCNAILPDYTGLATAWDPCDSVTPAITQTPAPGTGISGTDFLLVALAAQNQAGLTDSCFMLVTVEDTLPPTLYLSGSITVPIDTADTVCGAFVTYADSALDNCPGVGTFVLAGPPSGGFFPAGTTTVIVQAEDASGNTAIDSLVVTVTGPSSVDVTCPNDITTTLADPDRCVTFVEPGDAIKYDKCCSVDDTIFYDFTMTSDPAGWYPTGTTTVTATAGNPTGGIDSCSFNVTVGVDPLYAAIDPVPAGPCGYEIPCFGGTVAVSAQDSGGCGHKSYAWSSGDTSNTVQLGAGTFAVTVTDGRGVSVVDTVSLSQPSPISVQTFVTHVQCESDSSGAILLQALGGADCFPYTYQWSGPNNFSDTTASIDSLVAGTYTVTVTDINGCQLVYTDSVTAANAINAVITVAADTACATPTGPGYTYTWTLNGGSLPADSSCIVMDSMGTYGVTVTDTATGCADTDSVIWTGTAFEGPSGFVLRVYPNPSDGRFKLELQGFPQGTARLRLVSLEGYPVLRRQLNLSGSTQQFEIVLPNVSAGNYILELEIEGKWIREKLQVH